MAQRKDNLDELFGVAKMKAQYKEAIALADNYVNHIDSLSKKGKTIDLTLATKQSLATLKQSAKEVDNISKEQTRVLLDLTKAHSTIALAKQREASASKTQTQENIALNKEKERLAKNLAKEEAALKKANNAYEVAKKRSRALSNEYLRLHFANGENNKQTQKALRLAQQQNARLLEAEQAVGRFHRQVGNYNVVGTQFNQILREVPNAGLGMRTFLISISNNATYFAEAIGDARKQGASFKDIMKVIGGQMFGLVGVINLAVLALTYFASNMGKSKDEAKEAARETEHVADAIQEVIDKERELRDLRADNTNIYGESTSAIERRIRFLKSQGATETELFDLQKELQERRIRNSENEVSIYDKLTDTVRKYMVGYARAFGVSGIPSVNETLKVNVIDPIAKQLVALTGVTKEEAAEQAEALVLSYREDAGAYRELVNNKLKAQTELKDNQALLNDIIIQNQRNLNDEILKEDDDLEKEREERRKKAQARRKAEQALGNIPLLGTTSRNQAGRLQAQLKNQLALIDSIEKERLIRLNNQYKNGKINAEEYQKELTAITEQYERDRLNVEIDGAQKLLDSTGVVGEERLNLEQQLQDARLELAKLGNDQLLEADRKAKAEEEKNERELARKKEEIRRKVVQVAQQAAALVVSIDKNASQRTLNSLDKEEEALSRDEERKRARIERTIEDSKQKEDAITALEASTDAERQLIENRRREEQKRQAQRDKELAIFNILTNMYLGVAKELGTGGVKGIITGSAIIAFAGGLIAAMQALTVPAYAEGTDDHGGGLALVGEGRKGSGFAPELVLEPNKAPYMVSKPTLLDLPRHTQVVPMDDVNSVTQTVATNGGMSDRYLQQILSEMRKDKGAIVHRETRDGRLTGGVSRKNVKQNWLDRKFYN